MLRKIIAVLAGIIAATLIFMGFEAIRDNRYPLPYGIDPADHEAVDAYIQTLPSAPFIIVSAGWIIGSFLCGMIIRIISKSSNKTPAYIAGLFLTTAGIVDVFMYTQPLWFTVAGVVVFIPTTLLGHSVFRR